MDKLNSIEAALSGYDGNGGLLAQVRDHEQQLREIHTFKSRVIGIAIGASALVSFILKKVMG